MREFTRKAARETIFGAACLGVTLYLIATGQPVPEVLTSLVFALVVTGARTAQGRNA